MACVGHPRARKDEERRNRMNESKEEVEGNTETEDEVGSREKAVENRRESRWLRELRSGRAGRLIVIKMRGKDRVSACHCGCRKRRYRMHLVSYPDGRVIHPHPTTVNTLPSGYETSHDCPINCQFGFFVDALTKRRQNIATESTQDRTEDLLCVRQMR